MALSKLTKEKVLFFCYPLDDDGAPHQAMAAFWLAKQGVSVKFIAWGNHPQPHWLSEYSNIDYRLLPKRGLGSALKLLMEILRELWRNKPSTVYVQGAQQTPFLLWLPYFKKRQIKLVYHTQDYLGPGQHWLYETCEQFIARRAHHVVCNEINRARFMASSYRLQRMPEVIRTALPKWWVVPERSEVSRYQLLERSGLIGVDRPRLIVAGGPYRNDRMSPQLLDAFAKLPPNYGIIFSWMPQDNPDRLACEAHMKRLGLTERVIILDPVGFSDLLALYACCDIGILLYPNSGVGHFYQAPGRLTEYLRCGLSIVCSAFPGLELLTLKNRLGSVADPYNPTSIAQAIQDIGSVSDTELANSMVRIKQLANSELAYETEAEEVFHKIFD